MPCAAKLRGAGKRGGAGSDEGDLAAGVSGAGLKGRAVTGGVEGLHGVPLEEGDLDGLLVVSGGGRRRLRRGPLPGRRESSLRRECWPRGWFCVRSRAIFPVAIFLMKRGTSMWVGQAVHARARRSRRGSGLLQRTAACLSKGGDADRRKRAAVSGRRGGLREEGDRLAHEPPACLAVLNSDVLGEMIIA